MKLNIIKTEDGELRNLVADAGKILTKDDVYSDSIYLGCNDAVENWHEIREAEYKEILAEREAELNEDIH